MFSLVGALPDALHTPATLRGACTPAAGEVDPPKIPFAGSAPLFSARPAQAARARPRAPARRRMGQRRRAAPPPHRPSAARPSARAAARQRCRAHRACARARPPRGSAGIVRARPAAVGAPPRTRAPVRNGAGQGSRGVTDPHRLRCCCCSCQALSAAAERQHAILGACRTAVRLPRWRVWLPRLMTHPACAHTVGGFVSTLLPTATSAHHTETLPNTGTLKECCAGRRRPGLARLPQRSAVHYGRMLRGARRPRHRQHARRGRR